MSSLVKKTITEITFMSDLSENDSVRYFKLKYSSEGCGRFFTLTDESEKDQIMLNSSDDFMKLYEVAKELEAQGPIYCDTPDW